MIALTDVTLRDGSHAMGHRFTVEQVEATVSALEGAGVRSIELGHDDGLGGSTFNYGFSATDDLKLIDAAVRTAAHARTGCLLLPGVGTVQAIREVASAGAGMLRVATHCTEADIAIHTSAPPGSSVWIRWLPDAEPHVRACAAGGAGSDHGRRGANAVYVVDSAGALLPDQAQARVQALRAELLDEVEVGFHAHNNLGLGIANPLRAVEAGATRIDGALASLGAGAGNAATEVLVAVFDRAGIETGVEVIPALAAAEQVVRPYMRHEPRMDFGSVVLGYAGVYSSFLLRAQRAGERYGVPMQEILLESGRRRLVGGQEDVMIEIAVQLAAA
jgi:4-hydroxy 2-oxovalerate aldolase